MAFPATPLNVTVQVAFGADLTADPSTWTWTDITSYVRVPDRITITAGRSDEAAMVEPSTCRMRLDNTGGLFSPRNAAGTYYGNLGRNTPLRVRVDPGTGAVTRFSGFVQEWPPRWDLSGVDATVPIVANGILRRLGQGRQATWTTMERTIRWQGPFAYWPCEDGVGSQAAASAVSGQPPLAGISGTPTLGVTSIRTAYTDPTQATHDFDGTSTPWRRLMQVNGASVGAILAGTCGPPWTVQCNGTNPEGVQSDWVRLEWATPGGTYVKWRLLEVYSTGRVQVIAYDSAGAPTTVVDAPGVLGTLVQLTAAQSGGNVVLTLYVSGTVMATATLTTTTLAGITKATVNPDATSPSSTGDMVINHIALFAAAPPTAPNTPTAILSQNYQGELATDRFVRLCGEAGVSSTVTASDTTRVTQMGMAGADKSLIDLLTQIADTDAGVLREQGFGLGYISRYDRYNPSVALALDVAQGHLAAPPEPIDDDQRLRNQITITDTVNGGVVAEDTASVNAVGEYQREVQTALANIRDVEPLAWWYLHMGTVDEMRWPRLDLDLARNTSLITSWLACVVGSRVTVANPPTTATYDPIDALIEGYTETLGPYQWDVALTTSPAQPWQVWTVEGSGNTGRLDTDGSTLAGSATSGATTLSVATTAAWAPLWTTAAADFPFDINVAGERMTVTNITGTSSPQTFTVTRSVNGVVKAQSSGAAVTLWKPSVVAL